MNCEETRNHLMSADRDERTRAVAAHLGRCSDCAAFVDRLELARESLRGHQAEYLPDPYFAQRVSGAVQGEADQLGWAAVRLLPVALALTLVLTLWAWMATPGPAALVEQSPADDPLSWVLEEDGS